MDLLTLITWMAKSYFIFQTPATAQTAIDAIVENQLNEIVKGEAWNTAQFIFQTYPNLSQITKLIFNKTFSEGKSICELLREHFMEKECLSTSSSRRCYDSVLNANVFNKYGCFNATNGWLVNGKFISESDGPVKCHVSVKPTSNLPSPADPEAPLITAPSSKISETQSQKSLVTSTTHQQSTLQTSSSSPKSLPSKTCRKHFVVANLYFIAVNIIANTVRRSYKQWCYNRNGVFDEERLSCKFRVRPTQLSPPNTPSLPDCKIPYQFPCRYLFKTTPKRARKTFPPPPPWSTRQLREISKISTALPRKKHSNSFPYSSDTNNSLVTNEKVLDISTGAATSETLINKSFSYTNTTWLDVRNMTGFRYSSTTTPRHSNTNWLDRKIVWPNFTVIYFKNPAWLKTVNIINISGHSCSILCLFLLIVTYFLSKAGFTLMDRNLLCLSTSLLFAHLLQLNMAFFSAVTIFCKWGAVFLHLSLLVSFMWILAISFDLYITFAGATRITPHVRNKRFKKYLMVVYGLSTTIVVVCVVIGLLSADFSGYGDQGRCFVVKFWANLFAFTLPMVIILLASAILTVLTIYSIYSKQMQSNWTLTDGTSGGASARRKIIVTALVLKLSILCGFGWLTGFINGFIASVPLSFTFNIIVSFQGIFLYLAFGEQKSLVKTCFKRIKACRQRKIMAVAKETGTETMWQTTAL